MTSRIIIAIIITILLVSCSSSSGSTPVRNEPPSVPTTTISLATHTSIPAPSLTETPLPTETVAATHTPTSAPWRPLEKELSYGDWYFRCQVTEVSFEIVEILPKVDATGFIICDQYRVPAAIYDRNTNVWYLWGLLPLQNPTILDHQGERGVERVITFFGLGETYLDADNLIGKDISMSVNLPNSKNRAVFDTQKIGRFAGEYWGSQEAVDSFAQTGVLSNDDNILYPISLGVIK